MDPRSPYFVPPPVPPPTPPPPFMAGMRLVAITIVALVVAAVVAVLVVSQVLRDRSHDRDEDRARTTPSRREARKKPKAAEQPKALPVLESDPVRGGTHAWVTILEFTDFQCPYCARSQSTLTALLTKYGERLRLVFKDNPLPFHPHARPAAKTARVALLNGGQSKFWQVNDAIWAKQSSMGTELTTWGEAAGADAIAMARFGAQAEEQIDENVALAKAIGATGTPNFYIDGELLTGAESQTKFEEVIDRHLAEAKRLVEKGVEEQDLYAALVDEHWDETTSLGALYQVEVGSAPAWGPEDALVTVVVFGALTPRVGIDTFLLGDLTKLKDTRVVWRDLPADADERAAAAVVRAIGAKAGDARRREAIDEIFATRLTKGLGAPIDAAFLESLGGRFGLSAAEVKRAITEAPSHKGIDADIEEADDVDASAGTVVGARGGVVYVNGRRLTTTTKKALLATHASEAKRAKKMVDAGTAPRDLYRELTSKGVRKAHKHVTLTVPPAAPTRGPASAAVTIHVFSDFQCPFCARAMTGDFEKVVAAHASDVRVVYRHMPLPFHPMAEPAAQLALEAQAQKGVSSFWRVHDAIYRVTGTLDTGKLDAIASKEGLDMTKVHAAMSTHKYKAIIDADVSAATAAGLTGTPNFVVGNEVVAGAQPATTFEAAIARAKAKASILSPSLSP